jgi:protein-serine/threonine kinase
LLRRMLEPNPKLRCTIEEIMRNPWIQSIEVCTDPKTTPKHVHGTAQSRALSVMGSVH